METRLVSIGQVKPNENNPRIIKDYKFKKLVKSIQDFPQMLQLRPIVVNEDNVVLGGNMRLKACKEAGLKEVYIIQAKDLTEEQQKEFIVKDNVGFGEWDWDILANEWDVDLLEDWGLDGFSTMVAAHQLNRKCYGMELDPKYCQVIIDRMNKLDSSLIIKINGQEYTTNVND
jgi:ParB-like chromosome segregation protein Spo0J